MVNIDAIIGSRKLPIEFTVYYDNGKSEKISLELRPVKMGQMRKLEDYRKSKDAFAASSAIRMILETSGRRISDKIIDSLDSDQVEAIANAYMEWLNAKQKNSPRRP